MAYKPEQIENIFNKIILEMISGRSLRSILKDDGMPTMVTFLKWIEEDEKKMNHYARACNIRADYLFEEIIDIADDSSGDVKINSEGQECLNSEFVQRSKLKVDARKWVVSKMNPKKYGDKQETTHVFEKPIFNGIDLDVSKDNSASENS
jgi:hypothetical protein